MSRATAFFAALIGASAIAFASPASAANGLRDALKRFDGGQIQIAPDTPRPYIEYRFGLPRPSVVETLVDRGPIVEMIVNCQPLSGIITYSKIEKLFCSPKSGCSGTFDVAYFRTCGPR